MSRSSKPTIADRIQPDVYNDVIFPLTTDVVPVFVFYEGSVKLGDYGEEVQSQEVPCLLFNDMII